MKKDSPLLSKSEVAELRDEQDVDKLAIRVSSLEHAQEVLVEVHKLIIEWIAWLASGDVKNKWTADWKSRIMAVLDQLRV